MTEKNSWNQEKNLTTSHIETLCAHKMQIAKQFAIWVKKILWTLKRQPQNIHTLWDYFNTNFKQFFNLQNSSPLSHLTAPSVSEHLGTYLEVKTQLRENCSGNWSLIM